MHKPDLIPPLTLRAVALPDPPPPHYQAPFTRAQSSHVHNLYLPLGGLSPTPHWVEPSFPSPFSLVLTLSCLPACLPPLLGLSPSYVAGAGASEASVNATR